MRKFFGQKKISLNKISLLKKKNVAIKNFIGKKFVMDFVADFVSDKSMFIFLKYLQQNSLMLHSNSDHIILTTSYKT